MKKYLVIACLLIVSGCSKTPDINGVYQGNTFVGRIDYTFTTVDGHLKLTYTLGNKERSMDCRFIKDSNTEIVCTQDNHTQSFTVKDDETLVNQQGDLLIKKSK